MEAIDGITVLIPVGPSAANKRWLDECLASVDAQTFKPIEILLIDDGADLPDDIGDDMTYLWKNPCPLGVPAVWNIGIAAAACDKIVMLGSDDTLHPEALERAHATWLFNDRRDAWYWFGVQYMDGEEQRLPCNAAMVTKGLWAKTGGFSREMAVGASDTMLISILMRHRPDWLVEVPGPLLYNYRRHDETDTATRGDWQGVIFAVRDLLTANWKERPL